MTDQPTTALNTARKRFRDLGLSDIEALALLVPIVSEAYHEVADDAAEGATGTTWGSTPQEALAAFGRAYRSRGVECELRNAPPVPPFAKEQAAHEEHRRSLASLYDLPPDADWLQISAAATRVLLERDARHHALAAALGLRNTMGWATLVGTAAQVNKSATYHFERAKAADERLGDAEAALTRVRDALDALGPLARRHIALALGDTDTTAAANTGIERSNDQGTAAVPAGGSRLFVLQRDVDHTGVSGTGIVADGVQFPDGTVVTRWRSATASTVVWARIENDLTVHGYDGATRVVWSTPDTAPAIAQPAETAEPGAGTDGGEG